MSTITRTDVATAIETAVASGEFSADVVEQIIDAVLDVAPLSTWYLSEGLVYESDALDDADFWALVERIATA